MRGEYTVEPDAPGIPRILGDLAEGCLTPTEADAVVAWLVAAGLEDTPPWVVSRAVRIAGRGRIAPAARPAPQRWLAAVLVHDTRLRPRLAGARALDVDRPRLRYEADLVEIDLEVREGTSTDRVSLLGHIAAAERDVTPAWVTLDGPSGHWETAVDEVGQFSLEGLTPGVHRIEINLATEVIEISELRL